MLYLGRQQCILTRQNVITSSVIWTCASKTPATFVPKYTSSSCIAPTQQRHTRASSSSTRWKSRQVNDHFAKEARVAGLKSRAAFKLLELDSKHRLFKKGETVVDLGYAPGSWSQVAVNRVSPGGRVVGIDIIPAQPPRGASSIQGNFLSPAVQDEVRRYVRHHWKGRARERGVLARRVGEEDDDGNGVTEEEIESLSRGIVDLGREELIPASESGLAELLRQESTKELNQAEKDNRDGRVVNVVLSDMSAPWEQITGTWVRSVNNPYRRMMNTSGMAFRDHAGSMVSLVRLDLLWPVKRAYSDSYRISAMQL